jgi:hypothetical protein
MSSLLSIASNVEAAVQAYLAVWDFVDQEEWRAGFKREFISFHLHGDWTSQHLK